MGNSKQKIGLILLAAGDSRRFQGNKLLSEVEGKMMYLHILDQIDRLPVELFYRKIMVTQYTEIAEAATVRGYEVVENRESHLGISHSIHLGLQQLADQADAVCFSVCDQPWLKAETISQLLKHWQESKKGLGCLSYKGESGNPTLFSRTYYPELLALSGDTGGKKVMKKHPEDTCFHEVVSEQELTDIDERADGNQKIACHSKQDSL